MVSGEEKLEKEPKSLNYSIYNNVFQTSGYDQMMGHETDFD